MKPDVARRQLDADEEARQQAAPPPYAYPTDDDLTSRGGVHDRPAAHPTTPPRTVPPAARRLQRFHGQKQVDTARMSRDADTIAMEVVQHLASLVGARVRVTIEIEADLLSPRGRRIILCGR